MLLHWQHDASWGQSLLAVLPAQISLCLVKALWKGVTSLEFLSKFDCTTHASCQVMDVIRSGRTMVRSCDAQNSTALLTVFCHSLATIYSF